MSAYNPNKQGWGFAAVVVVITAALFLTAKTIHARTYLNPRNPMAEQVYHDRDSVKAAAAKDEHKSAESMESMPGMSHDSATRPEAAKPEAAKKH